MSIYRLIDMHEIWKVKKRGQITKCNDYRFQCNILYNAKCRHEERANDLELRWKSSTCSGSKLISRNSILEFLYLNLTFFYAMPE